MSMEKIKEIVKSRAKKEDFEQHILIVRKYALLLAKKLNANEEVVELASYLHDIARLDSNDENHHINGAIEAEKILKEMNYSQEIIDHVKECVVSHRKDLDIKPKSIEAKIISDADIMAHFDSIPFLFFVAIRYKNKNYDESLKWVYEKIKRDWEKLTLPEAKEMMKEKYEAIMKVLEVKK